MRRPLVVANWKMQKNAGEAFQYATELEKLLGPLEPDARVEVVLAPPFTLIWLLRSVVNDGRIELAGQDLHGEETGAFTGAIAASQLADLGCRYVLIGHSERRQHFGETPELTGRKVRRAVTAGLWPILCVGETPTERERGKTMAVVGRQLTEGLRPLTAQEMTTVTIAYEPVWAIGTGKTAGPAQAAEVHRAIREHVAKTFVPPDPAQLRILYGGSVKPEVVPGLMAEPEIDGLLVGGASLDAGTFARIVHAVENARR